jgi:osmoprotectant transport system substrate-binding protein
VALRRETALATVAFVALVMAGCGGESESRGTATALGDDTVTIGSFNFSESRLLAEIYGQALRADGFDVVIRAGVGPRELVHPALARGLVEFVPEYAGTALEAVSLGESLGASDVDATHDALVRALEEGPLVALDPAPAQTANAFVVTRATAEAFALSSISDLGPVASRLILGGPPECPNRPFCLRGLEETYDLDFAEFLKLDTGGPLTHQALADGYVDVAVLFTTDPGIVGEGLVVLDDDRRLQPAENVTPIVHREVVEHFGPRLTQSVDAVSARLTTDELRALNGRLGDGEAEADVARDWLEAQGLG